MAANVNEAVRPWLQELKMKTLTPIQVSKILQGLRNNKEQHVRVHRLLILAATQKFIAMEDGEANEKEIREQVTRIADDMTTPSFRCDPRPPLGLRALAVTVSLAPARLWRSTAARLLAPVCASGPLDNCSARGRWHRGLAEGGGGRRNGLLCRAFVEWHGKWA